MLTTLRNGTIIKKKETKLREKIIAENARKHFVTMRCIRLKRNLEEFQDFGTFIAVLAGRGWATSLISSISRI